MLQQVEWYDNQSCSNRKKKVIFLWHITALGSISRWDFKIYDKNTQNNRSVLFLQLFKCRFNGAYACTLEYRRNGRSQTLFAEVWTSWATSSLCSAGHTVSSINIHHAQSTSNSSSPNLRCKCKAALPPAPLHCHSHISRQRLMGMEHCVTALPCIKKTCSWKVQDKWCLPSDTLTTCQSDSPLLRSGSWVLCWAPWCEGAEISMQRESSAVMRNSN